MYNKKNGKLQLAFSVIKDIQRKYTLIIRDLISLNKESFSYFNLCRLVQKKCFYKILKIEFKIIRKILKLFQSISKTSVSFRFLLFNFTFHFSVFSLRR